MKKPTKKVSLVVIVIVVIFFAQLAINVNLLQRAHDDKDPTPLISVIISSVEGLYKFAPIEAKTGATYIPEIKLQLPAVDFAGNQIRYSYNKISDSDFEMYITTAGLMRQSEVKLWSATNNPKNSDQKFKDVFSKVPNLQACSRGVTLSNTKQSNDQTSQTIELILQDGRRLYGYTEKTCQEDMSSLVAMVKQAKSY